MTLHDRAVEAIRLCEELEELPPRAITAMEALLALTMEAIAASKAAEAQAATIEQNVHRWAESVEVQVDQLRRDLWN